MFDEAVPGPALSDVLDQPDAVAAELARLKPSPEDAVALSSLDPNRLSAAGRVDLLVALERQAAAIAAQQQRVLASMAVDSNDERN
jgi:hypothetical protein